MNLKIGSHLTLVVIVTCGLFACKKNTTFSTNEQAQFDTAVNIQANDQVRIASDIDAIFNDVNTAMINQTSLTGAAVRRGVMVTGGTIDTIQNTGICAATYIAVNSIADTPNSITPYTITLTYGGNICDNSRVFSGHVTIYINPGTSWSTANDTVGVNLTNLYVKGLQADTSTILYNGTFYYTNVSGGSLSSLTSSASTPVIHSIQGINISVLFNNLTSAVWQIGRQRTYTYNNGLVISTTGIDTAGGIQNVSEYGGNRYGNGFITSVTSPLITTAACDFQVTAGQTQLTNPAGVTTMLFGLDSSGTDTGCPSGGASFFYKLNWTGSGENPYSAVRAYPYHN